MEHAVIKMNKLLIDATTQTNLKKTKMNLKNKSVRSQNTGYLCGEWY